MKNLADHPQDVTPQYQKSVTEANRGFTLMQAASDLERWRLSAIELGEMELAAVLDSAIALALSAWNHGRKANER
jgi:hypothetical protein